MAKNDRVKHIVDLALNAPTPYGVASENMSVGEKVAFLEEIGRQDLVNIFREWQPRQRRTGPPQAPLDQRVAITVTATESIALQNDVRQVNTVGERISVSQFIRNRALGSIDINGWRGMAEHALILMDEVEHERPDLLRRRRALQAELEDEDDEESVALMEMELTKIYQRLRHITAQNERRTHRLTGRMSTIEAETVKWRASRLCISTSDYLRFLIFDLVPNSSADGHMSLAARRRFYVSIIEVATNGWGAPPDLPHCAQCTRYMEEIERLRDRLRQFETFV